MTSNAKGDTESHEVNGRMQTAAERDEDEIFGDRTCNVNELRINRTEEDVKRRCKESVQVHQQQQSQGSEFHWERFLHVRSIKVLLVENDDSTRHIVAALLRNLNYEVIVAANGLQAWRILQDLTIHIDIILTEVVMPCLSGIGLLCKIMSHKTRKNVPVIMMSSHDSMALVFKCLSKGAVDFLGKPIRKNELKNLWQHVWRRCHSSSSSGSESGTQTQKSVKSKGGVKSDNNISSDDEDDNDSTGLKIGDESDDDSETQSSWTKEVDSSQAVSSWDQIAKGSDGTCAQIQSNAGISSGKLVPVTAPKEFQEWGEQIDNVWKGKNLLNGKTRTSKLQRKSLNEATLKLIDSSKIALSKIEPSPSSRRRGKNPAHYSGEHPPNEDKAIVPNIPAPQMSSGEYETMSLMEHAKILEIKNKDDSKEEPEVELGLKRPRVVKDTGKAVQTYRNVLRRLDLSAFSRFNTISNAFKAPVEISGSSSLVNCSLEIVKNESAFDIRSFSNINLLYQNSDRVKNSVDVGSMTDKISINPAVVSKDKLEATSAINNLNLSSVSTPMTKDLKCPPQQVILGKADDLESTAEVALIRGSPQEHPIQHIHHHHHHHVHHFHNMDRQQPLPNLDDLSSNKLTADAPHFRSLNVSVGPVEGNTGNYNLTKSASVSMHDSTGQNRSSTFVHAGGMNVEFDVRVAGKNGSGDASGTGSGNRIDQNKLSTEKLP